MKKIISKFCLIFPILLVSCATGITTRKTVESYSLESYNVKPQMEFIGYKADTNLLSTASITNISRSGWTAKTVTVLSPYDQWKAILDNDGLRTLGINLQDKNLATDYSYAYFGIYSLQELELYKSNSRYVTFVEVAQNKYMYKDSGTIGRSILLGSGAGFLGGGVGILIPGLIFNNDEYVDDLAKTYIKMGSGFSIAGGVLALVGALIPVKSTITFEGLYNIYIYDTETKSVIRKEPVRINSVEDWKGAYEHPDTNTDILHEYYSQIVANALLKKYDELNRWLNTLK